MSYSISHSDFIHNMCFMPPMFLEKYNFNNFSYNIMLNKYSIFIIFSLLKIDMPVSME